LLFAAAEEVTADVKKAGGALPEFTWGERNRLKMQHPFGRFLPGPLARLLNMPAVPLPGDADGGLPLDRRLGHEWANDAERVSTVTVALVDGLDEAVRVANEETSGLAAGIVAEDESAAHAFLDGYRGTAAYWHATTRYTDGFELTGAPETGINVDWTPGPRGPVTYRDPWLRQYRLIGGRTPRR